MKVVKSKEYQVPICEFGKMFGITEHIDSVYYYGKSCRDKKSGEDEDDYVTIEVKYSEGE